MLKPETTYHILVYVTALCTFAHFEHDKLDYDGPV